MLAMEVPGHPHQITFGNIKFHMPVGLPLSNVVQQVILQILVIYGGFYNSIKHTIIRKEANRWPDIIRKIINEYEKKTKHWGTT